MAQQAATVFVVDDDASVRQSLALLMRSIDLDVESFASASAFLDGYDASRLGCLILDVRMPGMSGLELQEVLEARRVTLPIIFLTAHGDVPMAVKAVKAGAVDFLQKPFRDQDLIDKVQHALARHATTMEKRAGREDVTARIASLTRREHEVMDMVVEGKANKVIAIDLGLSQRTVEIHRARVMKKMRADSLSHLVQMVLQAKHD